MVSDSYSIFLNKKGKRFIRKAGRNAAQGK